jgi:DNA-binding response OmpR family regulator
MIATDTTQVVTLLKKRINILLLDDNPEVVRMLEKLFDSPYFNLTTATSLSAAREALKSATHPWHSWILDLNLGSADAGLNLVEDFADFPYVTILSGLRDVYAGSRAYKMGILNVFDK